MGHSISMADSAPADRGGFRGGFGGRGRGRGRGDRGRGRGRGGRGGRGKDEKEWIPVTKLGRLVKDGKIKSLEEIYLFSLPIKENEIIDFFLGPALKDEVLKIMPVQKQTRAGQRTRFKAFVAIGDFNGHVGLGVKCSKEVATAIRGAIILAKLSVIPVRRGYWGNKIGKPHTVPCKVTGKCGSVVVRLIPAHVELVLSVPLFPRSCCTWLVLMIATLALVDRLLLSAISPKQHTLPLPRHTAISPQICGRKLFSPRAHTRSSPTTWPRIIAVKLLLVLTQWRQLLPNL